MTGPRVCPKCRLLNEPDTEICDCGYNFVTGTKGIPRAAAQVVATGNVDMVEDGALEYRRLVGLIGVGALLSLGSRALHWSIRGEAPGSVLAISLLTFGVLLAVGVLSAKAAYRVALAVDARLAAAYAVGCFVPGIGILTLLALSSRASDWARRHGLEMGLLGPTRQSLDALRRASRK